MTKSEELLSCCHEGCCLVELLLEQEQSVSLIFLRTVWAVEHETDLIDHIATSKQESSEGRWVSGFEVKETLQVKACICAVITASPLRRWITFGSACTEGAGSNQDGKRPDRN